MSFLRILDSKKSLIYSIVKRLRLFVRKPNIFYSSNDTTEVLLLKDSSIRSLILLSLVELYPYRVGEIKVAKHSKA